MEHIDWPTVAVYITATLGTRGVLAFLGWLIAKEGRRRR